MEHYFTNNSNLESELRILKYNYKEQVFIFYSDNGVFSKDKIDYGSKLLVETILSNYQLQESTFLDVGCGYGFIGIVLARTLKGPGEMIDVNQRAIHLATKNISENNLDGQLKCFESDIYLNVKTKYHLIVTNPPIRAGKEVVYRILSEAQLYLADQGELWFVMNKNQGAKSTLKYLEKIYICEIIEKSKGFWVIKAKKR